MAPNGQTYVVSQLQLRFSDLIPDFTMLLLLFSLKLQGVIATIFTNCIIILAIYSSYGKIKILMYFFIQRNFLFLYFKCQVADFVNFVPSRTIVKMVKSR